MLVLITWHGRTMAVPSSQLTPIDTDELTAEAIADWVGAADRRHKYMFGPAFLVAPVYQQGQTSREVYLPAGADWYNYFSVRTSCLPVLLSVASADDVLLDDVNQGLPKAKGIVVAPGPA